MKNLVVIDYGVGNLRSVYNALKALGVEPKISSDPKDLEKCDKALLPGVGAFGDGMKGLAERQLIDPIKDFVQSARPLLGICLGMQLLMSKSFEFGEHAGLNLIEGDVLGFKNRLNNNEYDFKIPHIGWNEINRQKASWEKTVLAGLESGTKTYFLHSFYVVPKDPQHILAQTHYANKDFCSVVHKDNVYGCQFHPEKSSDVGLKILRNFLELK